LRSFMLQMVGIVLTQVMLKLSSVAFRAEAICTVALVFAIVVTLFILTEIQLNADSVIRHR
jgi:hypothetical protein